MISVENIDAGYGGEMIINNVSMDIEKGKFIGLVGPNGSGKTTLLRVISAMLKPASGKVLLNDKNIHNIKKRELAKTMAVLPQDSNLPLPFTVRQIVLMGRFPYLPATGRETQKDFDIADNAMKMADVAHLSDRAITELSGGERQRTLIAMCIAQQPKILLLDEPTSHLDIGHQISVFDLIKKLNEQAEMTVIAVLHDLNLAAEYCHKIMVMSDGKITASGKPEEVLTSKIIREVFDANVMTVTNPTSQKPHIILSANYDQ